MRKSISICILALLVFQNTSSLWTIGAFYINQDYIAKNVCINRFDAVPICKGQCYLSKELKNTEKQEQKIPTVTYKEIQLFFEYEMTFSFSETIVSAKRIYPLLKKDQLKSTFIFSIYHPPRYA
ncbi:hypothetical protein [Flavobacterium sp.]|uniref:hypothetical protein n=1 Tax=Flavobacterium sp. TaxID=239 RepID=UPI0025BA6E43|nr:hypothetical protein [Flavobacterium sp.]